MALWQWSLAAMQYDITKSALWSLKGCLIKHHKEFTSYIMIVCDSAFQTISLLAKNYTGIHE